MNGAKGTCDVNIFWNCYAFGFVLLRSNKNADFPMVVVWLKLSYQDA
ncbi:hypothetical protein ACP4OV_022032 [Aristida adscensionis]